MTRFFNFMMCFWLGSAYFGTLSAQNDFTPISENITTDNISDSLLQLTQADSLSLIDSASLVSTRPKVAIVLSGGGAKGIAHIGALKVIEQAGIPIDMIVGTSMGALIGGLYSVGYTTEQLDSIVSSQDWKVLLSDTEDPSNKMLYNRQLQDPYMVSIPFHSVKKDEMTGGFIQGVNLGHLFYQLLYPYNDSINFNELPIPYACVAVDLVSGRAEEFHDGNLQTAMRASMSIPGVFAPVRSKDKVFIDGGTINNYPVDVAQKMGADIIIGVDVQADLLKAEHLKGLGSILFQVMDVATNNNYFAKIDSTDIYIKVDVSGYNAASFTPGAILELKNRGEKAALDKERQLITLRHQLDSLGVPQASIRKPRAFFDKKESLELESKQLRANHKQSFKESFAKSFVNMSVRYDNLERLALLIGLNLYLPTDKETYINAKARLGDRNYLALDIYRQLHKNLNFRAGLFFEDSKEDIYFGKTKVSNIDFKHNRLFSEFVCSWRNFLCQFGVNYQTYHWDDAIISGNINLGKERYFTYYAKTQYTNSDDRWFPTHGHYIYADYMLLTNNLLGYKGHGPLSIGQIKLAKAFSPRRRTTILPCVRMRIVEHTDAPIRSQMNLLGGLQDGDIFAGQLPFSGIFGLQFCEDAVLYGNIDVRQHIGDKHYICGGIGVLQSSTKIQTIFDNKLNYGLQVGYCYRSFLGPLTAVIGYSDITKEMNSLLSLGYIF